MDEPKGHIARRMLMENPNSNMAEIARIVGLSSSRVHQIRDRMKRQERRRAEIMRDKETLTLDDEAWRYIAVHAQHETNLMHCVRNEEPMTAREARARPDAKWLLAPNFGAKSLQKLRAILGYDNSPLPMSPDDDMPASEWLQGAEIGIRAHNVAQKIAGNGTVGDLRREIDRRHRGLGAVTVDELRAALGNSAKEQT